MRMTAADLDAMDRRTRVHLMNSITGYKSATLIGTVDLEGRPNVAMFSSVTHLGSHPPLLGFFLRPKTVPRHTYENLIETGRYTFNVVSEAIVRDAHHTSAKYDRGVSEFDHVNLNAEWRGDFEAPFVEESPIGIGLSFEEEHEIRANQTSLVVGRVVELHVDRGAVGADGWVDLERLGVVAASGCDTYALPRRLARFAFARPGETVRELDDGRAT